MAKNKKRKSLTLILRNYFITGVVVLIPIGFTLYLTKFIIGISSKIIPENINYDGFSGLSNEVKSKFKKIKPKTMGQALRIDGITPAAVYILLSHLKRKSIKHIA